MKIAGIYVDNSLMKEYERAIMDILTCNITGLDWEECDKRRTEIHEQILAYAKVNEKQENEEKRFAFEEKLQDWALAHGGGIL